MCHMTNQVMTNSIRPLSDASNRNFSQQYLPSKTQSICEATEVDTAQNNIYRRHLLNGVLKSGCDATLIPVTTINMTYTWEKKQQEIVMVKDLGIVLWRI